MLCEIIELPTKPNMIKEGSTDDRNMFMVAYRCEYCSMDDAFSSSSEFIFSVKIRKAEGFSDRGRPEPSNILDNLEEFSLNGFSEPSRYSFLLNGNRISFSSLSSDELMIFKREEYKGILQEWYSRSTCIAATNFFLNAERDIFSSEDLIMA